MKFKSLFLLILSLGTVSSLVDIHSASAQRTRVSPCTGSRCPVRNKVGVVHGGGTRPILPPKVSQPFNDLMAQGNFTGAESLLVQFLGQAETAQDISGQAAAHQALGDVYKRMSKPDLASSHLTSAGALYKTLGNAQGSSEVRLQLQQIQLQQIQLQQIQLQQIQLRQR